jgi:hypothetical protein
MKLPTLGEHETMEADMEEERQCRKQCQTTRISTYLME